MHTSNPGNGWPSEPGRLAVGRFTAGGARVVSHSLDGTVRVWDVELLERSGVLRGHSNFVYDVAFSPDGRRLASSGWDGTARLWDATSGQQFAALSHDEPWVTGLAYSRDGGTLATVCSGKGLML